MMLIETSAVPATALPLPEFKDHLRLGTGFADDAVQDAIAESYLRAAMSAIEGRIGKALIARNFLLVLVSWRGGEAHALPVAPVGQILSVAVKDAGGAAIAVSPANYRLVKDDHRPRLAGIGGALPTIPPDGTVEVAFTAGFGPAWLDVPADLRQAVLLLAAQFHEQRHEAGDRSTALPFGVMALIERWRTVRVLGGGEA
jgi:uncharacterized phiE125 gp8 family phage protein